MLLLAPRHDADPPPSPALGGMLFLIRVGGGTNPQGSGTAPRIAPASRVPHVTVVRGTGRSRSRS